MKSPDYRTMNPSERDAWIRERNKQVPKRTHTPFEVKVQRLRRALGNKCELCGYDKCLHCLRIYQIAADGTHVKRSGSLLAWPWDKIKAVLPNLYLICANCWCEIENGARPAPLPKSPPKDI